MSVLRDGNERDTINNVSFVISFLVDVLGQPAFKPGEGFELSEPGANGLFLILTDCKDALKSVSK